MLTEGWRWYPDARATVLGLASIYKRPPSTVAGIMAALSQRRQWRANVRDTETMLRGGPVGGLVQARAKAAQIADGRPPDLVLRGPKIRAFYRALLGDDEAVVIDTWMLRALGHHEKPTPKQYKRLAQRVRREARRRGIPPAVWQAIVWCKARGSGEWPGKHS